MKMPQAIEALGALAHAHRLTIYRILVERGPQGLPAGVLGERAGLAPSSLTFHAQTLRRAGLLLQRRAGRQVLYSADFDAMSRLVGYLTENCCTGSGPSCTAACESVARPSKDPQAA